MAKKEEEQIEKFVKFAQKSTGGPPSKAYIDAYPGNKAYIDHLKERFDFVFIKSKFKNPYVVPKKMNYRDRHPLARNTHFQAVSDHLVS